MSLSKAESCRLCGSPGELTQCAWCEKRLKRGVITAYCKLCLDDPRKMEGAGRLEKAHGTAQDELHCNVCLICERQQAEDQLIRTVGGPTPEQLLKKLAVATPWFVTLAQASPEDKLSAHLRLKRRMDFTTTEQELSASLAMHDPMAAFVVDRLGGQDRNTVGSKTLEAFVTHKVPSIMYK